MSDSIRLPEHFESISRLQEEIAQLGIDMQYELPQIAVVGSQNAGKSSVLENIVGKDFLPRGQRMATRRPLVLRLVHTPGSEEYGEFKDLNKKFTDFTKIRDEIMAESDRHPGRNQISSKPIHLHIYSPNVPNLILIDLPGLVKVTRVNGPENIVVEEIREMILGYIKNENCLILAITPGNIDFATSDALALAKEVDKKGIRTIGVITKLDMMREDDKSALEIFKNELYKLHRGFFGVRCRSEEDLEANKSIEAALEDEVEYFAQHEYYRDFENHMNTRYLRSVLSKQLEEHLREQLPKLQAEWEMQKISLSKAIEDFKNTYPTDQAAMVKELNIVIDNIKRNFKSEIGDLGAEELNLEGPSCGTKIHAVFYDSFPNSIADIRCEKHEMHDKIRKAIDHLFGVRCHMYSSQMAFEYIVKREIVLLEDPLGECVDSVIQILLDGIQRCSEDASGHSKLRSEIQRKIINHIGVNKDTYKRNVLALIEMEKAYQNINHEDFRSSEYSQSLDASIREGLLMIANLDDTQNGNSFRFTLNWNTLSCFNTKKCNEEMFSLPLKGLEIRTPNVESEKHIIALFRPGGYVFRNCEELHLSSNDVETIEAWRRSFSQVLALLKADEPKKPVLLLKILPKDIDDIYVKVNQYMAIVKKTALNMVPKAIKLYIIDHLSKYISVELGSTFFGKNVKLSDIFTIDPKLSEELDEKELLLRSCQRALEIIRGI